METLVEFVLGNGYYEDPKKYVFEGMDIDRLKLNFDRLNVGTHPSEIDLNSCALSNEYFEDVELVWKIPHDILPFPHLSYHRKFVDLGNIFKCVKKNSEDPFDFIQRFSIFVRVFSDNCMTIARLIPVGIDYYELDSYDGITFRCYAYNMHRWFGDSYLISANSSDIWHQREIMLKSEMKISDTRYNELSRYGDDIMNFTPIYIHDTPQCMESQKFLCDISPKTIDLSKQFGYPTTGIAEFSQNPKFDTGYFNKILEKWRDTLTHNLGIPRKFLFPLAEASSLKDLYEYDFIKTCKEGFSIELINNLLQGGSGMNILDQLPKIKRLERNGAFTTAVWEDGTVTKLKKSNQDEDDFEKLVFFLLLKKLCDNNTHKMHNTLTDYLNTFRDATVDIPKQKEEKEEKKRKAKEKKKKKKMNKVKR